MNSVQPRSVASSNMSDLDGYSISGDYGYNMQSHYSTNNQDFGFDPPSGQGYTKVEGFSPSNAADPLHLSGWSGFDGVESKDSQLLNHVPSPSETSMHNYDLDRMLNNSLPNSTAIARFGQVTPPRSNSASSEMSKNVDASSPKTNTTERRKRSSKVSVKEEETSQPTTTGRKRKNARKSSTARDEQDDKRRQSLEKNRLAAAKCRINKKEKTELLQRSSHEKAVHNSFLKEQVMRMKEEVQQMNALLLSHANCEGCKSPEEIQKHLSNLGNEFFAHHMSSMNYEYPPANPEEMSHMEAEYFNHNHNSSSNGSSRNSGMLNPPLPDFDRAAEFECHTPMQTD